MAWSTTTIGGRAGQLIQGLRAVNCHSRPAGFAVQLKVGQVRSTKGSELQPGLYHLEVPSLQGAGIGCPLRA